MTDSNEVIAVLRKWQTEADSGHNDGWTQKHYKDKIEEVKDYLLETPTGCDYGIGG